MIIRKSLLMLAMLIALSSIQFSAIAPDEGMFPLSEISKLDLKKAGLKFQISFIQKKLAIFILSKSLKQKAKKTHATNRI